MRIEFHVTGADRKALVTAMSEILEARPKYLGMPTAAYEVDYFRIDKNGTPVCAAGLPMVPNGNDYSSKGHIGCQMWRCPYGKDHKTKCRCSCTSSIYGRVIKTRPEWDIRLYTDIPRSSETYKKIYKQRTATERINNRILNDYGLHRMFIHTKEHYSFMTTMIGICIHLDARYKQQMQTAA